MNNKKILLKKSNVGHFYVKNIPTKKNFPNIMRKSISKLTQDTPRKQKNLKKFIMIISPEYVLNLFYLNLKIKRKKLY